MLSGGSSRGEEDAPGAFYAAVNMHKEPLPFLLPPLSPGMHWHLMADTSKPSPHDIHEPGTETALEPDAPLVLPPFSAALCVGRAA